MVIGNFVHLEVSVYNNNNIGGSGPKAWRCGRSEQRRIWRVCWREKPARKFIHVKVHKPTLILYVDQFLWSSVEGWNKDVSGESAGERSRAREFIHRKYTHRLYSNRDKF